MHIHVWSTEVSVFFHALTLRPPMTTIFVMTICTSALLHLSSIILPAMFEFRCLLLSIICASALLNRTNLTASFFFGHINKKIKKVTMTAWYLSSILASSLKMEAVGACLLLKKTVDTMFDDVEFFGKLIVNLDNIFQPIPVRGEFICMKCYWKMTFVYFIETKADIALLNLKLEQFYDRAFEHNFDYCEHPTLQECFPGIL